MNHKNFATIEFFDKDGNAVTDLMSEAEYWKVTRVNVYNEESIQELKDYIDYIGFCSYADITEPGIWIWGNKDEINQGFVKVSNVLEKKPVGAEYKGRAINVGSNSHDCEARYKCSICNHGFGSWDIFHQKPNKYRLHYCPNCKNPLNGLE